jgi:tRNA synthetases class I (W and Y)
MQRNARPEDSLLFCSVGMHALTMPQDPKRLRKERRDMMAALLAIGLDPKRCVIFQQENVRTVHAFISSTKFEALADLDSFSGPSSYGARMAFQLHHLGGQVAAHDHLEGDYILRLMSQIEFLMLLIHETVQDRHRSQFGHGESG